MPAPHRHALTKEKVVKTGGAVKKHRPDCMWIAGQTPMARQHLGDSHVRAAAQDVGCSAVPGVRPTPARLCAAQAKLAGLHPAPYIADCAVHQEERMSDAKP